MKMKIMRTVVPVLAALVLAAVVVRAESTGGTGAPAAQATSGPSMHHHWHHRMGGLGIPLKMLLKSANLTADQKTQIHQMFQSQRAKMKGEFDARRAAQDQIASKFVAAGPLDASDPTIKSALTAIAQNQAQQQQDELQTALQIRSILSADQLQAAGQAYTQFQQTRAARKAQCQAAGAAGATPNP